MRGRNIIRNGSIVDTSYYWILVVLEIRSTVGGVAQSDRTVDLLSNGDFVGNGVSTVGAADADCYVGVTDCLGLADLQGEGRGVDEGDEGIEWGDEGGGAACLLQSAAGDWASC